MRATLVAAALAGAGCLVLASVLDWSGVEYSSTVDRRLALLSGAVVAALAVAARLWRPAILALVLVPGAVGLNMGIVNYRDVAGHAYEFSAYPDASPGIGLYLVLLGAVLTVAVGVATLALGRGRRAARSARVDA